jgi:EAL domain-containing protein (putative c-di-GMP-specific phosphodiesterase class I)
MTGASAAGGTAAFEPYPPQGRGGLDPRRPGLFADRLAHFRRAYLAQPDCRALGSLQILDLERVKARLGRRWAELLPKVLLNVEGCIAHRLGPDELYLVVDETTVWILALGERRAEVDRRGRLIAADITERLLGVLPGGSAVGVRTLLFDFDEGLRSVAGVNGLRERVQRQMKRQGEAEARAFAEHAQQLVAFYRPILSLKAPLVVGYRAFVRLAGPDGTLEMPGSACPEQAAGIFDASVDGWLAERLATELVRTAADGGRALLVLPVHYATLADPALRGPWLERLGPLPKDAVRRFAVELIDLPPALPRVRIAELATRLAGRAGHLMLRSPAEAEAVRGLAGEGVFAVSVNVTDFDPADPDTSTTLTGVARACAAAGLRSLAVRVGSAAMAEVARAAGIDYLSGDACLPALRAPGRVVGLATG